MAFIASKVLKVGKFYVCKFLNNVRLVNRASGAVWKSRWTSWAPRP